MKIRALVRIDSKQQFHWNPTLEKVTMSAVHAGSKIPEALQFAEATPSGSIELQMKKSVAAHFELGKHYWVDFTPVEE